MMQLKRLKPILHKYLSTFSTLATPASIDSLYCVNIGGAHSVSGPILVGLLDQLLRRYPKVGFFQPIGSQMLPGTSVPKHCAVIKKHFQLNGTGAGTQMYGVGEVEAASLLAASQHEELFEKVYSSYSDYIQGREAVIIEGSGLRGLSGLLEFHGRMAAELNARIVMVSDLHHEYPEEGLIQIPELVNSALIARQELVSAGADVAGYIINRVPVMQLSELTSQLNQQFRAAGLPFAGAIPRDHKLSAIRLNEVCAVLNALPLFGSLEDMDALVEGILVCTTDISKFLDKLNYLSEQRQKSRQPALRPLVITSKERADVVLSLAAAHVCGGGPNISALLLTNGSGPSGGLPHTTEKILQCLSNQVFPILEVKSGIFDTVKVLADIDAQLLPDSASKIYRSETLFSQYIDIEPLLGKPPTGEAEARVTPRRFVHQIYQTCRLQPQRIVLPEAHDRRVLTAAAEVTARGLAQVILLGDPAQIHSNAHKWHIDVNGIRVINPLEHPSSDNNSYAQAMVEIRKVKEDMTLEHALDQLRDFNTFGTMMVAQGDADGMVSGSDCTTAATIRPALRLLRSSPDALISSVFFMCLPDKVLAYADCAVVVEPSAEQLATIGRDTADTASAFGIRPKVAMLSYSTGQSGHGPAVDKVSQATEILKQSRPDLPVEGPIQYDAAVSPTIGAQKFKGKPSPVAGKATVCVFPDLNTGNNTYKAVQQSTGAIAIGPLLQGLSRPVNDLSRGCTVADIVNTVACTAVQAIARGATKDETAVEI